MILLNIIKSDPLNTMTLKYSWVNLARRKYDGIEERFQPHWREWLARFQGNHTDENG